MAWWIIGQREGGRVEQSGNTYVESRFGHLNFVIFGFVVSELVLGPDYRVQIPRHSVSVRAAYGRTWSCVTFLSSLTYAMTSPSRTGVALLVGLAVGSAIVFGIAMRAGRLSADELARRAVFRRVTGWACNPAFLVFGDETLEPQLHADLVARADRLAPNGYRDALAEWTVVATSAGDVDAPFLAVALTLARVRGERAVEDAVWERLKVLAASLPETVTPITAKPASTDATDVVVPAPVPWTPAPVLGRRRGSLVEDGLEVTIHRAAYTAPPLCASCLAPADYPRRSDLGWLRKTSIVVPHCRACASHGSRASDRNALVRTLAFCIGGGAAALAAIPGVSLSVSIALASAGAVLCATILAAAFPVRRAVAPATLGREGARLVAATNDSLTLFCSNEEWAERLRAHYDGTSRRRRRLDLRSLSVIPIVALVTPVPTAIVWHEANPAVAIDNGLGVPLDVWVDGRVVVTAPPSSGRDVTRVRVTRGTHAFGWSARGASAPTEVVSATIEALGEHRYLFDPAAAHCYSVTPTVYGDASVDETACGPQAVRAFHDMPRITAWFDAAPASEQLKNGQGKVFYEIRREAVCEPFVKCPPSVRAELLRCVSNAESHEERKACSAEAREDCP